MGILGKVKGSIKRRMEAVRDVVGAVQEEAKYPGRPQPHMAARNPLWGGESGAAPTEREPAAPPPIDPYASPTRGEEEAPGGGDFWFLEGETEGWEQTNPGKKEDKD